MIKKQKKEIQQQRWGLVVGAQIPLILIRDEIDAHIHAILNAIIDGLSAVGLQLAVVAPCDHERLSQWKKAQEKYPKWIKLIGKEEAKSDVFDIAVLESLTIERLKELREQRMVPVAEKGVSTFDPVEEKGNGFLYHENPWSLFAALVRAQETYRFPYDWDNLIRAVAKS